MTADNVSELAQRRAATPSPATCEIVRPPAEAQTFQDCLSRLASGVAIAACAGRSGPEGLLIHSLTGLSPQPPRILFCVRKVEPAHPALLAADTISLSILSSDQQAEADRFSQPSPKSERFGGEWVVPFDAPPRLSGALASVEGRVRTRIDAGSHTVFILDVTLAETQAGAPLVYFERGFLSPAAAG